MTHESFSFRAMLSAGWQGFKKNWKFILLAGIATALVQIALQVIQTASRTGGADFLAMVLATIFVIIIGIIIKLGWASVFLGIVRNGTASWSTLKTEPPVWLRYVKAYIWYALYLIGYLIMTTLPFALLAAIGSMTDVRWPSMAAGIVAIVAGAATFIFFAVRYQFLTYAVIDYSDRSSRDIFRKAGEITRGSFLRIFAFDVTIMLVNLAGLICLVVGLIATIPTTKLAEARVYTFLKDKHSA